MNAIELSVVLPAHRADDYLRQALLSAEIALSALNAELIVVANGRDSESVEQLVLGARTLLSTTVARHVY